MGILPRDRRAPAPVSRTVEGYHLYKRWQVAGLLLTAGGITAGVLAAVRWHFPDTRTAIVGTWVRDRWGDRTEGYTFRPDGRYERGTVPGGPYAETGRYEVSRGGGSVRLVPDAGPEYRISVRFEGRNGFYVVRPLLTGETAGEHYFRQ